MADRLVFRGQEFRALDDGKVIEGHAAVFEQVTDIGGMFFEVIERGAFDGCDFNDVPFFFNHDFWSMPLARSRIGDGNSTLRLSVDDVGLAITATLDVDNNADAKALYSAVARGDISGMSFAFVIDKEEWIDLDSEMPTRRITKIKRVLDVSACTFPAYEATDIHTRALNRLEEARKTLDKARSSKGDDGLVEVYRLKNRILGGI